MKRLIVLAPTFPREIGDGTPGFVLDLALEQARHFEVRVLTPHTSGAKRRDQIGVASGTPISVIRYRKFGLWPALLWQALSWRPNAVHAHQIYTQGLVAALAAPWIPRIIACYASESFSSDSKPVRMLKKFALRRARLITAVTSEVRDRLLSWGARARQIQVMPMGVDIAGARAAGLGARRRKYRIVFVGRLVEKKGVEHLIEALRIGLDKDTAKSKRLHPTTTAIIIGDGPLRAELEAKAAGLPIEFRGQQSQLEVLRAFAEATIAAIPSVTAASGDREGLPIVLLEAAACGAFIVASNLPGINEVVVDGETGLLVEPGDPEALLAAIRHGLERVAFRESCVTLMSSAVSQFDRARVGARYSEMLQKIL